MGKFINLRVRLQALMVQRELSKAKRIASMRIRLRVSLGGWQSYYEEI